jgi:hypothetical protein
MPYPYIKSEIEWLKSHGERDSDGKWWCKTTRKPILTAMVGRSIHWPGFHGAGGGEVRTVVHLACEGYDPDKTPPSHGTPIVEDQLVEEDGSARAWL